MDMVGPDRAEQQAEEPGQQALDRIARRDHRDQGDAEQHHDDHFDAVQVIGDARQVADRKERDEGGDEAAHGRGEEAQHQRLLRHALLGHRMAVERGRRRASGAGNVQQDRRNARPHVRGDIEADHEGHTDLNVDRQREGQQDDDRVVGAETGDGADDDADGGTDQDQPPVARGGAEQFEEEIERHDVPSLTRPAPRSAPSNVRTGRAVAANSAPR